MPKKYTIEEVKSLIEEDGTILLSKIYTNSHTCLDLLCSNNHSYKMNWNNFSNGHRCPVCAIKYKAEKRLYSYEYVKNFIENKNFVLISKEYKHSFEKLEIKCNKNHLFKKEFSYFKNIPTCPQCFYENRKNHTRKHTYEYIKEQIEKEIGYKLLSTKYRGNNKKLLFECPYKHHFEMIWNAFQQGQRCPQCIFIKGKSKAEKEIFKFIKSFYMGIILENDRSFIINPLTNKNLELDIYLPEIKFAIEYNGVYWHNKTYMKIKDIIKKSICSKFRINLIIITDDEWNKNKNYVLEKIRKTIEQKNLPEKIQGDLC